MGIFDRSRDTRTTDQKLEAMAAPGSGATEGERRNAEHLLFKRRQRAAQPGSKEWAKSHGFSDETQKRAEARRSPFSADFPPGFHGSDPKPHVYTASRGDALGCDTCARSKDNPRAHHIKQVG